MLIAFGKKNAFKVFASVLTFYFVSIAFGGMSFMILFSKNPEKIVFENNHFKGVYPFESLSLAGIICFLLILFISFILRIKEYKKSELVEIEIINDGKCHKVKALFDTGNLLKEPITNHDVIIVEKSELYKVCDKDFLDSTNDILEGKWLGECFTKYKFCLIPFSSLGNENGLLIGFKPDYIKVILEEEYLKNEVFIGIYDGKLTNNNLYTSLIGLNILNKEECINEFV
jgi:stage II sporulation protein GA (sporulation sigma-E factor processing peptidase)